MFSSSMVLILVFSMPEQRPMHPRIERPRREEVAAPVAESFDGNTSTDGAETVPCIFQPGVVGMVKVELTCGETAKVLIKTSRGSDELPIHAGNTLLTMLPADGSISLVGRRAEPLEVHWSFTPKR